MPETRARPTFPVATPWSRWYNDDSRDDASALHERKVDRAISRNIRLKQPVITSGPSRIRSKKIMNKTELVDAVADASELSKADAARAVDALVSVITGAMKKGDTVTLVGFGTFQVRARAARTGRNPKTGDSITIKASNNPAFKAGKALKDAVN